MKQDLKMLNIDLSFDTIKNMTKFSFKKIVKNKIKQATFNFLMQKEEGHSKLNNLKYKELVMQPYFKSTKLNTSQVKQLFRFRTRMSNVKANFKFKYSKSGYLCPLSCGEFEDDQHLLKCSITKSYRRQLNVKFENTFSGDSDELGVLTDLLMEAEKTRDAIVEKVNQSEDSE